MPITLTYRPDREYVFVRVQGQPTPAELEQLMVDLTHSETFPADVNTLIDVRELDMAVVSRESEEAVNAIRARFPQRGRARLAMLVKDDEGFGMGRMFALLSDDLDQEMGVFRSVEEAEQWLGAPPGAT